MKLLHLTCLSLLLAACQQVPSDPPAAASTASEGQAFAQEHCSECHAIGKYGVSPRSAAPAFPVIVNHEGLTADTLGTWLKGAHNYPSEMDFQLNDRQVGLLVGYMLTLKDPHYRRPPD